MRKILPLFLCLGFFGCATSQNAIMADYHRKRAIIDQQLATHQISEAEYHRKTHEAILVMDDQIGDSEDRHDRNMLMLRGMAAGLGAAGNQMNQQAEIERNQARAALFNEQHPQRVDVRILRY